MPSAPAPAPPAPRPGPAAAWAGLRAAWAGLDHRRRRVVAAVLLVLLSLLLPWYSEDTITRRGPGSIFRSGGSLSGYAGMGFIEASLLVVLLGLLTLLWARGRRKRFAMPFDDGTMVCAAAGWMGALIVYRLFARPHGSDTATEHTLVGLSWGIFLSLLAVAVLFLAGLDLRRHGPRAVPADEAEPEPDGLPDVDPETVVVRRSDPDAAPTTTVPRPPLDAPTAVTPRPRPPAPPVAEDAPTAVAPRPRRPAPPDPDAPVHEWPSRMRRAAPDRKPPSPRDE